MAMPDQPAASAASKFGGFPLEGEPRQQARAGDTRKGEAADASCRRWFEADYAAYRGLGYTRWQAIRVLWRSRRFLRAH